MCGRYTQVRPWAELVELYRITEPATARNLAPRYNIAPTQDVPVVRPGKAGGGRELTMVRWGLVPSWAKDLAIGARLINARAETLAERPAFRDAFRRRRCLIVADGFYEWQQRQGEAKQPHWITVADGRTFAFAGLWDRWAAPGGERMESCTIVTTDASPALAPIHARMPVILDAEAFDTWLAIGAPPDDARSLLRPYGGALRIVPVSRRVNSVRNDDPGCIEAVAGT